MTPPWPSDDEPVLSDQTRDDTDVGWGERPPEDDDVGRLLDERPPHHQSRDD